MTAISYHDIVWSYDSNNSPTRRNSFTTLLLDVYVWLNTFRMSPHPSSEAYNCTRSLWFYRWREAVGATRCNSCWSWSGQTTTNNYWILLVNYLNRMTMHGLGERQIVWFGRWAAWATSLKSRLALKIYATYLLGMLISTCKTTQCYNRQHLARTLSPRSKSPTHILDDFW